MPVTVVPTSLATVAIDTFITELSSVIRNCPAASVIRTTPDAFVATSVAALSGTLGRYRDALPRGGLRRLRRHDARGVESQLARPPQPVPGRVDRAQRRALGRHAVRAGRRGLPLLGAVLVGAHRPRARVDHDQQQPHPAADPRGARPTGMASRAPHPRPAAVTGRVGAAPAA